VRFPTTQWNILDAIKAGDDKGRQAALAKSFDLWGAVFSPLLAASRMARWFPEEL